MMMRICDAHGSSLQVGHLNTVLCPGGEIQARINLGTETWKGYAAAELQEHNCLNSKLDTRNSGDEDLKSHDVSFYIITFWPSNVS